MPAHAQLESRPAEAVQAVKPAPRSAAAAQTGLGRTLNDSAQVQAQMQMRALLNQGPRAAVQAKLVQLMSDGQGISDEEELIQSKSAIQRRGVEEEEIPGQRAAIGEDDLTQMQSSVAQRDHMEDDELLQQMPVQRCGDTRQRRPIGDEGGPVQSEAAQRRVNETGMPDHLKAGVENLSGLSMDNVRVHYNSPQPATLQAHAYTQGSDIHVAPGQERHLAHEAWHVVQQAQGRVQPTMQMHGTAINDDNGLEHEADVMGAQALQKGVTPDVVPQ